MPELKIFESGATRSPEGNKPDPEGFLSPLALDEYFHYMHFHRRQSDGSLRASDNWAKGIPISCYMKSLWRHFFAVWKLHRGYKVYDPDDNHEITLREALCGVFFNCQGYLHELIKKELDSESEHRSAINFATKNCGACFPDTNAFEKNNV